SRTPGSTDASTSAATGGSVDARADGARGPGEIVPIGRGRRAISTRAFAAVAGPAAAWAPAAALAAPGRAAGVARLNQRTDKIGPIAIASAYKAALTNPGA